MNILIETIIYLVAVIGMVAIIASFYEIFNNNYFNGFRKDTNKVYIFKKDKINSETPVIVDIYLKNMTDSEIKKITKLIENNKSINEIVDYINIYKTFDKD